MVRVMTNYLAFVYSSSVNNVCNVCMDHLTPPLLLCTRSLQNDPKQTQTVCIPVATNFCAILSETTNLLVRLVKGHGMKHHIHHYLQSHLFLGFYIMLYYIDVYKPSKSAKYILLHLNKPVLPQNINARTDETVLDYLLVTKQ